MLGGADFEILVLLDAVHDLLTLAGFEWIVGASGAGYAPWSRGNYPALPRTT